MTPYDIERALWIKRHIAGVLQACKYKHPYRGPEQQRISNQIGKLAQQIRRLEGMRERYADDAS